MRRKVWSALFAAALLLNLGAAAAAAENTGSIRVVLGMEEGEVSLYPVGVRIEGGYLLRDAYGGGFIQEKDAMSAALAQWLVETRGKEVQHRLLDADGAADFSRLEEGLYLLVQTKVQPGYTPISPFLIPIPCGGQWHVQANPKTESEPPSTGQGIEPFLGAAGMVLSGMGLLKCWRKRKAG